RYGKTRFGQSCLLARRLVEAGVPFVQVNWSNHVEAEEDSGDGGWDHHYRNFQIMQDRHGPWLDQTLSTFLLDLDSRGLLERTLVVAVGEFGRSPKINDKAGREHWEHCYSALLAGGGGRGGRVIGASAEQAVQELLGRLAHPLDAALVVPQLSADVGDRIPLQAQLKDAPLQVAAEPEHHRLGGVGELGRLVGGRVVGERLPDRILRAAA